MLSWNCYNTEILSWLRGTVDGNVMAGLEKALYLNDGKKLQEFLRKYMITCISCFDGAAEGRTRSGGPWLCADRSGTETFYHGMMLGLAVGMSSRYYIRSNRESGEGRFDLVLEPKVHFLPGIIMEFKATFCRVLSWNSKRQRMMLVYLHPPTRL